MTENKTSVPIIYAKIIAAVKDFETNHQFGQIIIKFRHGKAVFMEKQVTEQVKLQSREQTN